jgi:hypothetical protein
LRCDVFGRCSPPLSTNISCVGDESCTAFATCNTTNFTCHCNTSVSTQKDTECVPLPGVIYGECGSDSDCKENTECSQADKTCKCKEGFEVSYGELACKKAEGSQCQEDKECALGKECDMKEKVCKRGVLSPCSDSTDCASGMECEDGACKRGTGKPCNFGECLSGSICDIFSHCTVLR